MSKQEMPGTKCSTLSTPSEKECGAKLCEGLRRSKSSHVDWDEEERVGEILLLSLDRGRIFEIFHSKGGKPAWKTERA